MKSDKQIIGFKTENIVIDFFQKNQFEILEKNFSWKFGEIDIIAKKNNVIHFIEVKKRNILPDDLSKILPNKKIRSLIRTANYFINFFKFDFKDIIFQFDLIIVVNNLIYFYENIFEAK